MESRENWNENNEKGLYNKRRGAGAVYEMCVIGGV